MNDRTRVQNPLTIIAIFAGIAEIAGTTVLLGLPIEIQRIFVWFVMIFPLFLVASFFAVLIFKHRVLYAPSDFDNQEHFVSLLQERSTAKQAIAETNEVVNELKELAKSQVSNGEILDIVRNRLVDIENELKNTALTYHHTQNIDKSFKIKNDLQTMIKKELNLEVSNRIINLLETCHPEGKSLKDIIAYFNNKISINLINNVLKDLLLQTKIIKDSDGKYYCHDKTSKK